MCGEDGVGVDTSTADRCGVAAASLAERYASIGADFRAEMSTLSEASAEMPVMTGALDYTANIVGHLVQLQAHTEALGANSAAGAAVARRADLEIGTGLGTIFAA